MKNKKRFFIISHKNNQFNRYWLKINRKTNVSLKTFSFIYKINVTVDFINI